MDMTKCVCDKPMMRSDRPDQKCGYCQAVICRATKRRNNYRTHGPCQTDATREFGRQRRKK